MYYDVLSSAQTYDKFILLISFEIPGIIAKSIFSRFYYLFPISFNLLPNYEMKAFSFSDCFASSFQSNILTL